LVNNPTIYGVNSNPFILPKDAIVELTIINTDGGPHPFHLHSHNFQVIARSGPGPHDGPALAPPANLPLPKSPMRRDVVLIYGMGYAVVRFKADNPGITLFHCHIEWHVEAGLTATFIEAPTELQKMKLIIPDSHKNTCQKQGIKTTGNAAGNSKNWLDLKGANTEPALNSWGYVPIFSLCPLLL
jgi:iron transport multicopper oxidase